MATLSKQIHYALSNYISNCNLVPVEKSCKIQKRTMEVKAGQDLVNLIIWNRNAEISEILSRSVSKNVTLPFIEDLVIFVHDMGESSCSTRMRSLIKNAYSKKPNTAVMTIDYSPVVRLYTLFLCMIKNLNLLSYIIFRVVGLITGH